MSKVNFFILVGLSLLCCRLTHSLVSTNQIEPRESSSHEFESAPVQDGKIHSKLPQIFNFERFKTVFKRIYPSKLEEVVRKSFFLARAFRVFFSVISYKYSFSTSYLAINEMSDWTDSEKRLLHMNRREALERLGVDSLEIVDGDDVENGDSSKQSEESIDFIDEKNIEEDLEIVFKNSNQPGFREVIEEIKVDERDTKKQDLVGTHNLKINRLFREPKEGVQSVQSDEIPSNNLNYKAPVLDDKLISFSPTRLSQSFWFSLGTPRNLIDSVLKFFIPRKESLELRDDENENMEQSQEILNKRLTKEQDKTSDDTNETKLSLPAKLPDEVFIDHRQSGCLLPIRDQGRCASCYIFTTIALYEWAFCNQTGNHVAFSEQYVVDCGYTVGSSGCSGGIHTEVLDFVRLFGLELRDHYPYIGRVGSCPYDSFTISTDRECMGYIRPKEQRFAHIPMSIFEECLEEAPIIVNLAIDDKFDEYGGGVADLDDCNDENMHAMLLIGSGREDGKEYWLLRNSYRNDWGEEGHYKLNKETKCFDPEIGSILLVKFEMLSAKNKNEKYDRLKMKQRPRTKSSSSHPNH